MSCESIALSHAQNLEAMRNQSVAITDTKGIGAGIILDSTHVVTANHVVSDEKVKIYFFTSDKAVEGTVEKRFKEDDVAIVSVKVPISLLTPTYRCTPLVYGEAIYVIGMPLGMPWILSEGVIASDLLDENDIHSLVAIDATVREGNSGGPVFDSIGRVIGMSEAIVGDARHNNTPINLITPNSTLCKLLGKV